MILGGRERGGAEVDVEVGGFSVLVEYQIGFDIYDLVEYELFSVGYIYIYTLISRRYIHYIKT